MKLEPSNSLCPKCKSGSMYFIIHDDGYIHFPFEMKCINCNSYYTCSQVLGSEGETSPKLTRADRIRKASDDELASILNKVLGCNHCPGFHVNCSVRCKEYWLDWLREDAEI